MNIKTITISREYGSGGRIIGKILSEELGFDFYDKEIVSLVAKESGFNKDYIDEVEEKKDSKFWDNPYMINTVFNFKDFNKSNISNKDKIQIIQSDIIRNLTNNKPCIIIGRCADYVLNDREDVLNIFIYSNMEDKINRVINEYKVDEKDIENIIKNMDKSRANYYEMYTGQKWGNTKNYHMSLDSSKFGLRGCIEIIKNLLD